MNLDHMPEVTSSRLLWREQLAALPRALWYALRRLLRREHRFYLTFGGVVVAKFVSQEDHGTFLTWLAETHIQATDFGFTMGKEYMVAQSIRQADAGTAGTD